MNVRRFRSLHAAGVTYAEIARECGRDWRTVRKYLTEDASSVPPAGPPRVGTHAGRAGRETPRPGCTAGNKPFTDWGQVFADDILAGAILDRLLHHCDVVAINGPSYRLKNRFLTPPNGGTMT